MSDWDRVDAETAAVIGERPTEYDSATRQNLSELLLFEIEVFQDRYEVYRGFDGKVDIRYDYHKPGEPISSALIAELPARS